MSYVTAWTKWKITLPKISSHWTKGLQSHTPSLGDTACHSNTIDGVIRSTHGDPLIHVLLYTFKICDSHTDVIQLGLYITIQISSHF